MRTIMKRLRAREEGDEGFTLIELLVVLLIIGILLAIAIPTYLSVTKGAKKSAAQSNLNTALTAAKAYYTDHNGAYPTTASTLATSLSSAGTSLTYGTTGTSGTSTIDVDPTSANEVVLAASDGSTCYGVADVETTSADISVGGSKAPAGTYWTTSTLSGSSTCTAAGLVSSTSWSTSPTPTTTT